MTGMSTRARQPSPGTVLLVDDDAHMRELAGTALSRLSCRIIGADSAESAFAVLEAEDVDGILCDVVMPGQDGLSFLSRVREKRPDIPVALMTGHGRVETVIQALRLGAADFLTKPFRNDDLRAMVQRLLAPGVPVPRQPVRIAGSADGVAPGLLGKSPEFLRCVETARRVAQAGTTVLVTGESGTGKEVIARYIHEASGRRNGPFIAVNCGAIPENLIESELFGHARGAFTGAISDRPGKIALAHGGTLFLDEIGEMPLAMQVRLLRVLQERVVEPLGGGGAVRADFRLIAATHRDLREAVRAGRFREDLWFRLHVVPVALPPLRARGEDVLLLARHYVAHFNARYGTAHALDTSHEEQLVAHAWPGNVRELINAIERAIVLSDGGRLVLDLDAAGESAGPGAAVSAPASVTIRERKHAMERDAILTALEACRWNKTRAAERLGISRRGLQYKVKAYGI